MTEQELQTLRDKLKSRLDITWDDAGTDNDLLDIIKSGIAYLDEIAGTNLNYIEDLKAKQLLLDYGRYVYNNVFELFEINFNHELLKLSIREGVVAYEASTDETTS
ncbi:hypothetical protein [Piscibacillus salipiscarius]|uniref:Phage gp6-like head-tail connector protein n=1 Tax=Piscibacillus salipiscarius TaxID=299480 RepID=A0ABW5Q8Z0_9BACI|nr:hypothetical protein [Piscibacillus salipiscarius]